MPYFEPYAEYLADRGYSQISFWKKTLLISKFSWWLGQKRIAVGEITPEHVGDFLHHSVGCRCPKRGETVALCGITDWLQERDVIKPRPAASTALSGIEVTLQEYAAWLREQRGLAPTTVEGYAGVIRRFLTSIRSGDDPRLASIHASQITDYIRRNAPSNHTFSAAKNTVTALRSFFRFALHQDYIQTDLAAIVPSVAGWSMASIPRAMPADCVRQLLTASKSWRKPRALRDRAILLLLARVGLRAQEVAHLNLDDIDWARGWLKISGKGRQQRPLPLPHDVGQAIVTYLRDGRPESKSRRVFLNSRAPFGDLGSHRHVSVIVQRAIEYAGLELDGTGSHQLRHALAVDMLRQGLSLTEIGQMLRHRSPEATRRYAKVDLGGLREVALPWPGEMP